MRGPQLLGLAYRRIGRGSSNRAKPRAVQNSLFYKHFCNSFIDLFINSVIL